jgi:tyrosine-protein kinase Etk/Wzc
MLPEENSTGQKTGTSAPVNDFEDEINLLDYLQVLLKHKGTIFKIVLGAVIVSVIVSLLLPKMYTATARILPPAQRSSRLSSLLGEAGGALGALGSGFLGGQSTSELYVGILKSRTVADALIKKFDLKELYEAKYMASVYKRLAGQTDIQVSRKDQIISVSVEGRDPHRAADMANAYVDALDLINRTVNITEGHRKRVFLENRLKKVQHDLSEAETGLKEFQEKYKLVAIEEQARVSIEGAARIKGEIIAAETELEVLKQFGTERQNEAIMLKSKIAELRNQLAKIERGKLGNEILKPNKISDKNSGFYLPFNEFPALGMQLARLMREAKVQEKVFELMTTQYELAKIEEARDVNTIQVLDSAIPPDTKSGPKRRLIVILSAFVAFFLAVFLVFSREYVERIKSDDRERYERLRQGLKLWDRRTKK